MKLTADMFDFEKYDYEVSLACTDPQWQFLTRNHDGDLIWLRCSVNEVGYGLYRRPKPPPRYILLNEGEKLQPGDEYHAGYVNGWSPGSITPGDSVSVRPKEIWRRKVQE